MENKRFRVYQSLIVLSSTPNRYSLKLFMNFPLELVIVARGSCLLGLRALLVGECYMGTGGTCFAKVFLTILTSYCCRVRDISSEEASESLREQVY